MRNNPVLLGKEKVRAKLDKSALAQAVANMIRTLVGSTYTDEKDFWIQLDLSVHIVNGKLLEKAAKVNVYSESTDPYGTNIVDLPSNNEIPTEVFRSFCDR